MPIQAMRLRAAAGPPPSGFPQYLSHTDSAFTTAATSHVANIGTTASGDLLLAFVATDGTFANSAVTTPSGWTSVGTRHESTPSVRGSVFIRVADGTESGGTVNFVTAAAEEAAVSIVRVQAGTYSGSPEVTLAQGAASNTPAAPGLAPSWGSASTLWITGILAGRPPPTGFPLADNNVTVNAMVSGTDGCSLALCSDEVATGTLSPGNWSGNTATVSVALTLAVRPI
jgi:hypothetical protein